MGFLAVDATQQWLSYAINWPNYNGKVYLYSKFIIITGADAAKGLSAARHVKRGFQRRSKLVQLLPAHPEVLPTDHEGPGLSLSCNSVRWACSQPSHQTGDLTNWRCLQCNSRSAPQIADIVHSPAFQGSLQCHLGLCFIRLTLV